MMMKAQIQNPMFIVSEIQVSYSPNLKPADRPFVSSSLEAFRLFYKSWDLGRIELTESFSILLLNRANRVIGISEVSRGGFTGTVVDPKVIFSIALKCAATGLILCHNHPTSSLRPSEADIRITRQIADGCKILTLELLDHLILSSNGYFSFKDEGLL